MTEMEMGESSPRKAGPPGALNEALSWLTGEGRAHEPAALLAKLRERFAKAGHGKLADLVYEMVKACLAELPDFSVRTLLHARPRPAEVISGEVRVMSETLAGVKDPTDLSGLAQRSPEATAALADAAKCIDVLERLEGASGRQQLALALAATHAGDAAGAEQTLRALLARGGEAPEILRIAEVNLGFALLRQARYAEVVPVAEAAIERSPEDPVPWFNLLAARSELGDPAAFERDVESLRALYAQSGSELIRGWIENDLAMLGDLAGLAPARIAEQGRLPDAPEDAP
jgi:tetratricopeptide (TPR) repeat protein